MFAVLVCRVLLFCCCFFVACLCYVWCASQRVPFVAYRFHVLFAVVLFSVLCFVLVAVLLFVVCN